jgi:ribonuclease G
MTEEILINATPNETRVALVENGMVQEVMHDRHGSESLVGQIFMGRIERVVPGLQAAFINIGLERSAFMHVTDICSLGVASVKADQGNALAESVNDEGRVTGDISPPQENATEQPKYPDITSVVHEGQQLLVQVYKDAIGSKGARVTCQISIPSRYLVMLPQEPGTRALSVRITDESERERLQEIVERVGADYPQYGLIARTNAEGVDAASLQRDFDFLVRLWEKARRLIPSARAPQRIHQGLSLPLRAVRDNLTNDVQQVRVDSPRIAAEIKAFLKEFVPSWSGQVVLYEGDRPIFDFYNIEEEISKALRRFVPLKSGGNLVIDQNEAMTTIDVNTGRFVGHRNLEDTIFRTNLEAAHCIARQVRLRNIGGIIILDFIDMQDESHRQQVLQTLQQCLEQDPVKTNISGITELGLVEMTRKRTTECLQKLLCEPCPECSGRGYVKTVESLAFELFREITRAVRQFKTGNVLVLASPEVIDHIIDEQHQGLQELEESLGKRIRFQPEEAYGREQFDVVLT